MHLKCRSMIWTINLLAFSLFILACQKEVGAGPVAPDFSLKNLSSQRVTLKQYRGNIVILDFWATWCPPCRASIPELIKLQDKFKKKGLVILGISMDDPRRADNQYIQSFCEKFKVNYMVLRYNSNVLESYFGRQAPALPTMYVIDREGIVRDKHVGFSSDALQKSLERLL